MQRIGLLVAAALLAACSGDVVAGPARPRGTETPFEQAAPVFPRLTAAQYRSTLEDVLGAPLPATPVERDTNPYLFFNIGAATTSLSEVGAQQYEEAAHRVAAAVIDDAARRAALMGCEPAAPDDACVAGFVARVGRRLYRRSLTEDEQARWLGVSRTLGEGDALRGVRLALAGMLQSPHFLYRVELGVPSSDGTRRYADVEMASRLAFLLWNTGPDDELLDAAERGDLGTPEDVYGQAVRMLDDPRAREAVQAFFAQYLDLGRLEGLDRDPARYPLASESLPHAMRTEVELLVDDLVFRHDGDLRELFRTRRTFVNDELAALYGVEAEGATRVRFVPVELAADGPRAGVLTLGAFLAMNAHPTETSPTLRGKYVRERILCELVPPPPDDVALELDPDPAMPRTLRERLELHRTRPDCAACHAVIDPPGFLFEGFDSIGAVRTHDSGYPVDTSGALDGIELADGRGLGEALAEDPRVPRCMVRQLYRHASARLELREEELAVTMLTREFAESGYRFRELLLALATSEAFRTAGAIEAEDE